MRTPRGMTLIEVMSSLAILGVAALGLVGTMVVATGGNALAARRTLMTQFGQARMELLVSQTRTKIPTSTTSVPVNCGAMATGGAFDPNAAPGTGGWMLDVVDGSPPAGAGDNAFFGPVLVDSSSNGTSDDTVARTQALRSKMAADFLGGADKSGCGSSNVTLSASVLCRELHVEPYTLNGSPMLRAYVRVVQGGGPWWRSYVTLQQDIAQ
jgi:prepilin-type N-terminal cleavage/methylation domain-containing protein